MAEKPAATFHPRGTGPTPRTAADVLREAARVINAEVNYRAFITFDDAEDIARLLTAAGLLATAPCCPPTVETIDGHWLVEHHTHCTCGAGGPEGHEPGCGLVPLVDLRGLRGWASLVEDILRDHPPTAEHDREIAAQALRDAAVALGHTPRCHPDPDRDPYYGCECRTSLLYARADRIAAGEVP